MIEYITIGIFLLAFEYAYFIFAKRLRIVDRPHHQSSHKGVVVRGGGVLFYVAYWIWFLISDMQYPLVLIGLSIVAVTSFIDDIHSISPKLRLFLQFVGIIVMLYETEVFYLPVIAMMLLSVACVGSINIYNFMDGINGLTGGYSMVVLLALIYVNQYVACFIDIKLLLFLLLATFVFSLFNFRIHSKCFAGDVGSLSMGVIIVFLISKLCLMAGHLHWMAFLVVYAVDGGLTILHRIMLRENILKPHKKHAYQIMTNELKMPHLLVSVIYMMMQAACCAWFIAEPSDLTLILQLVILGLLYLAFMKKYYRLHVK